MRQIILDFPKQFGVGINSTKKTVKRFKNFKVSNIIICGMGGSALPGDILQTANRELSITKFPIIIHRNYGLPKEADKNSLIVCISYSGNTEETIAAFNEAKKRKLKISVIASGGKLIELAKRNKLPYAEVPSGIQPRCALGYQFSALASLLSKLGVLKSIDKELLYLGTKLNPGKLEPIGKKLATNLKDSILLVYSSEKWGILAKIWKIKFNENSKIPAFFNVLPEMNHNEMTGIGETKSKKLKSVLRAIILEEKEENKRNLKRMKIMAEILKIRGIKVFSQAIEGKTFFERFFSTMLIGDWASYYLAIFQGIDPIPVKLVEEFKKRMKN